jgi:hypothetical protein
VTQNKTKEKEKEMHRATKKNTQNGYNCILNKEHTKKNDVLSLERNIYFSIF